MISDSLLASASVVPASSAASVGRSPTAPVMPLSTTSHARPAASTEASSPSPEYAGANSATCASNSSGLRPARGQPDDPEAVGVGAHEVEGLGADRPGRAEDDDVAAVVGELTAAILSAEAVLHGRRRPVRGPQPGVEEAGQVLPTDVGGERA